MSGDIWEVIGEIGIELHPDRVNVIANKISALVSSNDFEKVRSSFGPGAQPGLIDCLGKAWGDMPDLTPLELAAALRGAFSAATLAGKREVVDMVWTGPTTGFVSSRHTEQVLLEVISSARERLFLVSFVAYDMDSITEALRNAVSRKVEIHILLESAEEYGGKITVDSILLVKKTIPSANIYAWKSETLASGPPKGAVHAKCAVADRTLAFVSSANLTRAAMEKNMELGVLVRGGNLPKKLDRHLASLATTGVIEKV